jgi:tRNA-specific 2-thiouridylase
MQKVIVAMSGGVDSSVACVILKEKKYEVIGLTLKFFDSDNQIKCCGADESIVKAKQVCDILNIRHYSKDARKYFNKYVIENFINAYLSGYTPNPCIECNKFLKFEYLFNIAKAMDVKYIATGHYARIEKINSKLHLLRGKDPNKDQSYFLYPIKKEYLANILFPLGEFKKEYVREIANRYKLPTSREKESKDICFTAGKDYNLWLKDKKIIENKKGYIKDIRGKILGTHNGFFNYTIGQRRNLGIAGGERLYVTEIKPKNNEVIIAEKKHVFSKRFILKDLNWLDSKPKRGDKLKAQIRYRHIPKSGIIEEINLEKAIFAFDEPQFAITKGQSAVFYEDDRVIGGGIIEEILEEK